jgi:hypothetical protein
LPRAVAELSCVAALAAGLALSLFAIACAAPDPFGLFGRQHVSKTHLVHEAKRRREAPRDGQRWSRDQVREPFEIIVSLAEQQVALYGQDGLIARAQISSGMAGHATPMGVFSVISKARWHKSNIYSGAPMPYMQRITWSGIALHAGPRPGYPASHGCIRLPESFAIRLFHTTKIGTRVVVTRHLVAPVKIVHAKLFIHRASPVPTADATMAKPAPSVDQNSAGNIFSSKPPVSAQGANLTETVAAIHPAQSPRPISVFVSRKQARLFVRQGFMPLFDFPVTIAEPDRPFGTHVFTAMAPKDDGTTFQWTVVSIPSSYRHQKIQSRTRHHHGKPADAAQSVAASSNPAEVLDRITLPTEAIARISNLMVRGSSLIVSDNQISDETDADTDFIVLTP